MSSYLPLRANNNRGSLIGEEPCSSVDETFALQVDKCSQLLENALSLYSEAGQTAGQVKS